MSSTPTPTRAYVESSSAADLAVYARRAAQQMRAAGVRIANDPKNGRHIGDGAGGGLMIRYGDGDPRGPRIEYQPTSRSKVRTLTTFTDEATAAAFFEKVARHIRDGIERDRLANDPDEKTARIQRLTNEHRASGRHKYGVYRDECAYCAPR